MAKGGALAPFRQPVFRAIWAATLVSNFGSMIQSVGAAWLMTSLSDSARMVALVQSSVTLPIMLLALFAGAIADSYDRRLVMLWAQLLMLVAASTLAVFTWAGYLAPWGLLLATTAIGVGTALNGPSWQASLRSQVPIADLPAAVALNSIGFNLARSLGPAIGGTVMALFGPSVNFTVNALSYIALIAVLSRWHPPYDPAGREPLGRAMRAGLAIAYGDRTIRAGLVRGAVFGLLTAALWALMPLIARDLLHGDQATYGVILGAFGVGSIGGGIVATWGRARLGSEGVFVTGGLGFALGTAGAAWAGQIWLAIPFLAIAGASWVAALSTINIVVQINAPPAAVGRCLALYQMHAFGGLAAGSYLWGAMAEDAGLREALFVAAAGLALAPLLGRVLPLPGVRPAGG